jgi:membrane protein implicated in regulation of membrane protease activity
MPWWTWVLGGLVMLAVEAASPGGFFAVFFGVAAIVVGVVNALGGSLPAWAEWLLFTVLSVAGLLVFRRPLMARFNTKRGKLVDQLEGEAAVVVEEVRPGGVGRAELRGSVWSARTHGETTLAAGQRCRVEWVEGLTLWVRAE